MWNTIANIKDVILIGAPLVLIHFYVLHVYNVQTWRVLLWWVKSFLFSGNGATLGALVAFVVFGAFLVFSFGSLLNSIYLGVFGEKQELVYLGNVTKNTSVYCTVGDYKRKTFQGHNPDTEYNTSFDDLYRLEVLLKDPGSEEKVGLKPNRASFFGLVAGALLLLMFALLFTIPIHAVTYPAHLELIEKLSSGNVSVFDSYDKYMGRYGLTVGVTLAMSGVLLVLFLIVNLALMPKSKLGNRLHDLPRVVVPGNTIIGKPVEQIVETKKTKDEHGNNKSYDTGFRYVMLLFDWEFPINAYVVMKYHKDKYPGLQQNIDKLIHDRKKYEVMINDKLEIVPIS
ncbi:MAG: hypothetical protein OEX19_05820 [Gammaproteobacteria bacterium]|nr:hypothetical protein [Gammaproteobacteria bacterium]